jgi:hypothetical protein
VIGRVVTEFGLIHFDTGYKLVQLAARAVADLCPIHRAGNGKNQRSQNRHDGDHDQEFDEGEGGGKVTGDG